MAEVDTPSEICLILHILRKPNSLIALLFIQNNSQFKNIAKTFLPASMLSSSSIAYGKVFPAPQIFSKQQMQPSKLSSCCFCYVFSHYFAQFQLQFFLSKQVKCPPFQLSQRKQLNYNGKFNAILKHVYYIVGLCLNDNI